LALLWLKYISLTKIQIFWKCCQIQLLTVIWTFRYCQIEVIWRYFTQVVGCIVNHSRTLGSYLTTIFSFNYEIICTNNQKHITMVSPYRSLPCLDHLDKLFLKIGHLSYSCINVFVLNIQNKWFCLSIVFCIPPYYQIWLSFFKKFQQPFKEIEILCFDSFQGTYILYKAAGICWINQLSSITQMLNEKAIFLKTKIIYITLHC
jgi:hypothetical protein